MKDAMVNPPAPLNSSVSWIILHICKSQGLILDHLNEVILQDQDRECKVPKKDLILVFPNKMAQRSKGKSGNGVIEVFSG